MAPEAPDQNGTCHRFRSVYTKNLYENRMCNQWDNWRAYGPELLL